MLWDIEPQDDGLEAAGKTWDPRDVISGGSRMVPITTPSGTFRVWTKRVGTNPDIKVLLLHGGPGATDELYECFDTWLPAAGIEYYYYDQLGSAFSDQPHDASLWDTDRFVDEVEQVRAALKPGGYLCCLIPTFNQVEKTLLALRQNRSPERIAVNLVSRPPWLCPITTIWSTQGSGPSA